MVVFHCEHCGKKLGAKESQLGRSIKCPKCQQPVVVRDESAAVESVPPPAAAPAPSRLPQPIYGRPAAIPGAPHLGYAPAPQGYAPQQPYAPHPGYAPQPGYHAPQQHQHPVYAQPQAYAPQGYAPQQPTYEQPPDGYSDADPLALAAAASAAPAGHDASAAPAAKPKTRKAPPKPKPTPAWVYAVVAVVVIGLGVGGYFMFCPVDPNPAIAKGGGGGSGGGGTSAGGKTDPDAGVIPLVGPKASEDDWKNTPDTAAAAAPKKVEPKPKVANPLSSEDLYAQAAPSIGRVEVSLKGEKQGLGTGFFVTSDGLMITNFHVIAECDSAEIIMPGGTKYQVLGMVGSDALNDLALLKTSATGVTPLKVWEGDPPVVGTLVYAIGNPRGLDSTLSKGEISAIRRDKLGEVERVQINVPITHGSSGGALLGADCVVVGVTTSGMGEANLNFAVPSKLVTAVIKGAGK
ncbi:MAG TPA: trypsin-like peptidase domain-containing protein, partial [Tepidisphaeraceae bacterium]|nr:trypsin-like peptidase domain-containing protein [Tepidisphaeraceae bacterium]